MENKYEQTTLDNVLEQPSVLRRVLDRKNEFCNPFTQAIKDWDIRKVIFTGSGTSYNVSCIAEYYFKHLVGLNAEAVLPTVFKYYEKADWSGDIPANKILCVAISQSGTSMSTCEAFESVKALGCHTLCLTAKSGSRIVESAEVSVPLLVGKEITPAETKGYTASVLSVYLWALDLALSRNSLTQYEYSAALDDADALVSSFQTILDKSERWYAENKEGLLGCERLYVLGYGLDHGSMLEGMLKVGEMLRIPTIGYEMVEYTHGPTMAIKPNQAIIMIAGDGPEFSAMQEFRLKFLEFTKHVHVISRTAFSGSTKNDVLFDEVRNAWIAPLAYTVPLQILAVRGAEDSGIDTNIDPFGTALAHYQEV